MVSCAVFASGGGTNFEALLKRKSAGDLHVDFSLFVGNNSGAGAFTKAKAAGIDTLHIAPSHFATDDLYAAALHKALTDYQVEYIILAGYMKKLPSRTIKAYHNRIVNIHPALLPAFGGKGMYGSHVHRAVLEYGAKITGVTVHIVDEEYDNGPIIMQSTAPVMDTDTLETLSERVLGLEHSTYWKAIELMVQKKITIVGRKVIINA